MSWIARHMGLTIVDLHEFLALPLRLHIADLRDGHCRQVERLPVAGRGGNTEQVPELLLASSSYPCLAALASASQC